ncbi:3-phosphoshikimate 1-carboxyvinyltransferase [Candidatus Wirthbacteria bacterium CG2_30_54_11]|uniref:3-phosphoshikimate 1-carboxyvinyltransferase n=1 Tax=Candidatus Wirthbacteria bacterium CG2_30_54_11 TaxID=1817892 RepID=A0A1J5IE16_9BACT|nr:MAG: 3-phosphoshikimate 1-carboxyvinyltransferase [Candidatus Wirthbacteria bacterium CG2_30_54_11]
MIEIIPVETVQAEVRIPGSKSYTNRALIIAALAQGTSTLLHPLKSDDTAVMIKALREFGIDIEEHEDHFVVYGTGGVLKSPSGEIDVQNAGTAMRFLASLAALAPDETRLTGSERMEERPLGDLLAALAELGVRAWSERNNGCPPIIVDGPGIPGGTCHLRGEVSSQYLSSILMCAPYADRDVAVQVEGRQTSQPYIDMTLDIMREWGVRVVESAEQVYQVKAGRTYQSREYAIEADASSASYFMALAAVTAGTVRVLGINPHTRQGDIAFAQVLEQMGCQVTRGDHFIGVTGVEDLKPVDVDMNSMPDMVQTLAIVAACTEGETKIRDVANLRVKETDRLSALKKELGRVGVRVKELEDGLVIQGGNPHGAVIETYGDHRMAMVFAVLGCVVPGIRIQNPEVVTKSYPEFWRDLKSAGITLQGEESDGRGKEV